MPAYAGNHKLVEKPHLNTFKVKLDNTRIYSPLTPGGRHSIDFFLNNDDKIFIHEVFNDTNNTHSIETMIDGKWKPIYKQKTATMIHDFAGINVKETAIFSIRQEPTSPYNSLFELSLTTGQFSKSDLTSDSKDIEELITDTNRHVFGVKYAGLNPSYHFINDELNARMLKLQSLFKGNSIHLRSWTHDWKTILIYVEGSDFPGIYFSQKDNEAPHFVSTSRLNFDSADTHPVATWAFTTKDGYKIPTLLTIPKSRTSSLKNLPTIILPHGGPHTYDQVGFDPLAQAFADQGYLVAQPQYRGSTGFGNTFKKAGMGEWTGGMINDIRETIAALTISGHSNPKKICVVGNDYGGYTALTLGYQIPEKIQCIVALNPISNLTTLLDHYSYRFGHKSNALSISENSILNTQNSKHSLSQLSPTSHARNFTSSIIIIHGISITKSAFNAPLDQSKKMYKALKKAKKDVTFIKYKNNNRVSREEQTIQAFTEVLDFINRALSQQDENR